MQTPAILNISSPISGPAATKPAASASGGAFNQMLSQQIAERRDNAQARPSAQSAANGKTPETHPTGQAGKSEAKPAEQGNAAREAGETGASDRQREEQAAADAGSATPTATELMAQAAGALLMLQQTADAAGAAGDAAATLQDVAADGAARAGKHNLLGADPTLRNAGGDADFRASLEGATDLGAAADAALGMGRKAMDKLTELAAAKMQDTPAIAGAVAQLQPGMQELAQVAAGKTADRLTPHVGTPAWDQALGQKVVWMVAGAQQSASLSLNPPDLGPLQIVLNVSNGQADASFYAAQPEVRQALEAALPRLRDMMNEAGVELGQASVSAGMPDRHDQPGERSASQASHGASGKGGDEAALPGNGNGVVTRIIQGQGLVDTFV